MSKKPKHRKKKAKFTYRKGVGIVLLNSRGEVFVAQRSDMTGDAWQMPQGGIDPGEKPRHAAKRELMEEIGVSEARIIAKSRGWITYDLPHHLVGKVWNGRYRGQKQRWYLMRLEGADANIDLDFSRHPEFSDWRWVDIKELPDLIVPFKRQLYKKIVAEFKDLAVPADDTRDESA